MFHGGWFLRNTKQEKMTRFIPLLFLLSSCMSKIKEGIPVISKKIEIEEDVIDAQSNKISVENLDFNGPFFWFGVIVGGVILLNLLLNFFKK